MNRLTQWFRKAVMWCHLIMAWMWMTIPFDMVENRFESNVDLSCSPSFSRHTFYTRPVFVHKETKAKANETKPQLDFIPMPMTRMNASLLAICTSNKQRVDAHSIAPLWVAIIHAINIKILCFRCETKKIRSLWIRLISNAIAMHAPSISAKIPNSIHSSRNSIDDDIKCFPPSTWLK